MVTLKTIVANVTTLNLSQTIDDDAHPSWAGERRVLARGSDGRLWFAYLATNSSLKILYSDDDGDSWTEDDDIDLSGITGTISVHIFIDALESPHVIYASHSTDKIHYTKRTSPATWTTPVEVGEPTTLALANSFISGMVDSDGKIHIIVRDQTTPTGKYYTNESGSFVETTIWTDASSPSATDSLLMAAAMDQNDDIHLVYRYRVTAGDATQNWQYRYYKKPKGQAFPELNHRVDTNTPAELIASVALSEASIFHEELSLALDDGGNPHVVYTRDIDVDPEHIVYRTRSPGGVWSSEETVHDENARRVLGITVSVTTAGIVYVAWAERPSPITEMEVIYAKRNSASNYTEFTVESVATEYFNGPNLLNHLIPKVAFAPGLTKAGAMGVYTEIVAANDVNIKLFITDDFVANDATGQITEGPPSCAAEPDRASIVVAGEGTASTNYPLTVDFPLKPTGRWATDKAEVDAGYEWTHPKRATKRRIYSVIHRNITESDKDTLINFVDARKGPTEVFNFTVPATNDVAAETIKARFASDVVEVVKRSDDNYIIRVQIEEAF
jgi:hypothetical protein